MKTKDLILGNLVGRRLVMYDQAIPEGNHGTFTKVDNKIYPTIIEARTEPFGKKEDSYIVVLVLEWNNNQFEYMCGHFPALFELELKQ